MSTITIDEKIVGFTQEMLPPYYDIMYFLQKHVELYEAFNSYTGSTKSEVEEYSAQQLQQMSMLAQAYSVLAEDLQNIVIKFLEFDDKIAGFYKDVLPKMSEDVRKSLGE